jgi:uncharacterized delta-60 repeat protein
MWTFFSPNARQAQVNRSRSRYLRPQVEVLEDRCCPSGGGVEWSDPNTSGSGTWANAAVDACTLQSDGKILASGFAYYPSGDRFLLQRYLTNGNLDASFGSAGTVTIKVGTGDGYGARGVAVQSDGKIVLAGEAAFKQGAEFALARYTSSGILDTTFGNKGTVNTQLGTYDIVYAEVIQPADGKIIAAGASEQAGSQWDFAMARYNVNGSLDTSFGSGGIVLTNLGGGNNTAIDGIALQPNGQILVAGGTGTGTGEFTVARYNANGTLDTSFGGTGVVIVPPLAGGNGENANSVAVQSDGKIVAAGFMGMAGYADWVITRFNTDGSLDSTFGSGGTVAFEPGTGGKGNGVVLQPDGKIVVAGTPDFTVGRFNTDGSLDTTFEGTGLYTTQIGPFDQALNIVINPNSGQVILVGKATINGVQEAALAAFAALNPQIGSFTANPNPVTSGNSAVLTVSNITDSNPSATITQVAIYVDSNGDGKLDSGDTLIGYATQTSPGVWTLTYTVTLAPGTYTLFAQAQDNYGLFSNPLSLTLNVQ